MTRTDLGIVREPKKLDLEWSLRRRIGQLEREVEALRSTDCRTCNGVGAIAGFWLGTVKRCPACEGRGVRG